MGNFRSPNSKHLRAVSYILLYFLAITSAASKGIDFKFSAYSELVGVS